MIDGGPLRTSQSAGRRGSYRSESARYQPEEPEPVEPVAATEAPRQSSQHYHEAEEPEQRAPKPKKARNLSWIKWAAIPVIIGLLGVAAWMLLPTRHSITAAIETDKYQAVFLSNGQVYFGKLTVVNGDYMQLTDVYYLERQITADTETETTGEPTEPTSDNNFQLLKYSDVLYGSEDAMIISQDDVIRFENLRSDGVVAKAIANRR